MKPTLLTCRSALLRMEMLHRFQNFRVQRDENEWLPEAYDSALQEHSDKNLRDFIWASVYHVQHFMSDVKLLLRPRRYKTTFRAYGDFIQSDTKNGNFWKTQQKLKK